MARKGRRQHKRVEFRRNRLRPARQKRWDLPDEDTEQAEDTATSESVQAKGELSRKRTVVDRTCGDADPGAGVSRGVVVAVRGRFVEVDDDHRVWPCTVRRILRTLRIRERNAIAVGDEVLFRVVADSDGVLNEGVVEQVLPRRTALMRSDGRRTQVIAANVDQTLIVTAIREPMIKPHLLDRYLVAAHAGELDAIICINKIDLDPHHEADEHLERYRRLDYDVLPTSAVDGRGIEELRRLLAGKTTLLAGQSGVGKSSLLNAVQPGLNLKTQHVSQSTEKGRHTTTTAIHIRLDNAAVIDTPGIRALDVAMVPVNELEMHFVEFVDLVANCKFPDCTHTHEDNCAVKAAVDDGRIDPMRYDSYRQLFDELGSGEFYEKDVE